MQSASWNFPWSDGEYYGPHPHQGLDDDGIYLNLLQEVTHYPNDYHHGPSATVNTICPIDENPLPSRVDNGALAESPDFEQRLSQDLFHNCQDLLVEGGFSTAGPSPPPPMKPIRDEHDPLLTMPSQGSSPELLSLHVFSTDQHTSSWGSPPSPLPDRGDQIYPPSLSFPQESPFGPRAHLIPESYNTTGTTSSLPIFDILTEVPIPVQVYQEENGACNSWLPRSSTVAIQRPTMDVSTTTIPIVEGSSHPETQRQALWGVDGFAELSMTGPYASSIYSPLPSPRPTKDAPSPNFWPAIQTSHHVTTPPIASRQFTPAGDAHRKFWCRVCDVGFVQRQGLSRHEKDQHGPWNICHLCKTYEWSPARKYLFTKHLKRHHPEAVPA